MTLRTARPLTALMTLVLTLGLVVSTAAAPGPATASTGGVSGLDVSGWQHPDYGAVRNGASPNHDNIDWSRVRTNGQRFVIIKATEGTGFVNPYYSGDRARARAQGLAVGAYHFARPQLPLRTAAEEARHFVRHAGPQGTANTLPPVLDLERNDHGMTKAQIGNWALRFLTTVEELTGRTPMIYSYHAFLRSDVGKLRELARYPLWYARYTSVRPKPSDVPGYWADWTIWQYTSTGRVPGIQGNVDVNVFNGSAAKLSIFANGRVDAAISRPRMRKGMQAHISGKVDPSYAGGRILLRKKGANGYQGNRSTTINADGSYRISVRPTAKREHRFRVYLRAPGASARSNTMKITVRKPGIKVHAENTSITRGNHTRIVAKVNKFFAGERIILRKKRIGRPGWDTVRDKKVGKQGFKRFKVKPKKRTTHRYRVALKATKPTAKNRGHARVQVR